VPPGKRRRVSSKPGSKWLIFWLCLSLANSSAAKAPELKTATLRGFRDYVARAEMRNQENLEGASYLWIDELPEEERKQTLAELKQGDVAVRHINGKDSGAAAGGMIHDWQGMVFIPGANLDGVLAILQDYNNHASYYGPDVEQSKVESHEGSHFRVFMRFRRRKIVTVVLNTEQDILYFRDSPTRAHSRSTAIRIREVSDPGASTEKEKSPQEENGFLWQMETWWRMEEQDGGVYVQNEAVTLTRDIPTGLGWLIGPFVTSIPKETLQFTLGATRKAVLAREKR